MWIDPGAGHQRFGANGEQVLGPHQAQDPGHQPRDRQGRHDSRNGHHAGALPAWLAPVQVAVLNITDSQADYAREVVKTLQNQGLRVQLDLHNEKITYKIRKHSLQKLPYILVVGDKEMAAGAVAVRARGNQDLGVMSLESFCERIAQDIRTKR